MSTPAFRTTFPDPRTGTEVITPNDCLMLLAQHQRQVGRFAFVDEGMPLIVPVNFVMVEDRVAFCTGTGTKLEAALRNSAVAFEIDHVDEEARTGWSVVVRGRAEVVSSTSQLFALGHVGLVPFGCSDKAHWVMIYPETITGRRVLSFGSLR